MCGSYSHGHHGTTRVPTPLHTSPAPTRARLLPEGFLQNLPERENLPPIPISMRLLYQNLTRISIIL